MNQWKDEYSNDLYNQQYNQINKFYHTKNKKMKLCKNKSFQNFDAFIIVDWRNGNDYDIISIAIQTEFSRIDVTDMFTSDEIIEAVFGPIDWELVYRETLELS
jgi:C-terminal processing protease CtpA/Prc